MIRNSACDSSSFRRRSFGLPYSDPEGRGEARLIGNTYAEDKKKKGNELKATLNLEPEGLS
jgi:hypothetical protein